MPEPIKLALAGLIVELKDFPPVDASFFEGYRDFLCGEALGD